MGTPGTEESKVLTPQDRFLSGPKAELQLMNGDMLVVNGCCYFFDGATNKILPTVFEWRP
jgi:hypothetical protein